MPPRTQPIDRVRLGADFRIAAPCVLDPAHGEAGVYCVPVLLMHVQKLVREDVEARRGQGTSSLGS